MKLPSILTAWSAGIAIFSMFFGAGNVVFPLLLGQITGENVPWALTGLTITAVGAPLLGLLGLLLFEGDCKEFFNRMGTIPGYLAVFIIIALLGPFGVMPRCFVVAYGAIHAYLPSLNFFNFSAISGIISLLFISKREYVLPILGYILSPLLIISLLIIIVVGFTTPGVLLPTTHSPISAFGKGLYVGYDTMDLIASMLFSVSIWMLLKEKLNITIESEIHQKVVPTYIIASLIGGSLLGLIYLGLSFNAAFHHQALIGVPPEKVLSVLSVYLLGSKLAIVGNIAIALACLTTVMSLAVAMVDVIHVELMNTKFGAEIPYSYGWVMLITMVITVIISLLGFDGIMNFLHPIMEVLYPAIIVLTICNILYKCYGFKYVKSPVYGTLIIMIVGKILYS